MARVPSTQTFAGCNTPGIADRIADGRFDAFVVPGWSLRSYWQAVRACRRARVPVMVRGDSQLAGQRGGAVGRVKGVVFPHMLKQFDACLYVGQRNRGISRTLRGAGRAGCSSRRTASTTMPSGARAMRRGPGRA